MRPLAAAAALLLLATTAEAQFAKPLKKCPRDAVPSGPLCVDKYEASTWRIPNPTTDNKGLVKKIRKGKATLKDLDKAGATQLGISIGDYSPCIATGTGCNDVFAVSLPGVSPSSMLTWFQALAACKSSAKRLLTNAEWQQAVTGTPDPGPDNGTTDCNTNGATTLTGSRSACVSAAGAFDMVGNRYELVADWVAYGGGAAGAWNATVSPTGDDQSFAGVAASGNPGTLLRGGARFDGAAAGPLALLDVQLDILDFNIGFRCAR